jgi:hypothetical protein
MYILQFRENKTGPLDNYMRNIIMVYLFHCICRQPEVQ